MELNEFWSLIDKAHQDSGGVPEQQSNLLIQALAQGSEVDLLKFDRIFLTLINRAYTTDIWNAAYIMTDCSDDSFSDFRAWLIAQGKVMYETVLRDPDSLADLVEPDRIEDITWESFAYVAQQAYQQKKGEEATLPRIGFSPCLTGNLPLSNPGPEHEQLYPKLWAKYSWKWK